MIEGNTIRFGYGDISVGADATNNIISFNEVKNSLECGETTPKHLERTGNSISIQINDFDEYYEFYRSLNEIEKRNLLRFTFKDYVFDFSQYNEKSIIVIKKYLEMAVASIILYTAV